MPDKPKIKTRHFRLDMGVTSSAEQQKFFQAIKKVSIKAEYFRAQIGEIYLSIKGLENESNLYGEMLTDFQTVEDVLHEWRKNIEIVRQLDRRPQPEIRYVGRWLEIL
jgi:hypothetical protein